MTFACGDDGDDATTDTTADTTAATDSNDSTDTGGPTTTATSGDAATGDADATGGEVPTTGGETTGDPDTGGETTGDETTGPLGEGPGVHCISPDAGVNQDGPEGKRLLQTVLLGGDGVVGDLDVALRIHEIESTSYFVLRLEHAGTQVTLLQEQCEFNEDIDATFDDSAAPPACCGNILCGKDPLTGMISPVDPLAAFNGRPIAGEWTLEVAAVVWSPEKENQAVLAEFCLDIEG